MIRRLLLLVFATSAFAQMHHAVAPPSMAAAPMLPALSASVSGIVQTVSGSLITIGDGTITIDASKATIRGDRGAAAAISSIKPGDRIDAAISNENVAPGAPLIADRVTVVRTDIITITGPVQSIDPAKKTFTVLGRTIAVASDTQFVGAHSLADLSAGARVIVAAEVRSGVLTAVSVVDTFQSHETTMVFFDTTVKSIGATQWVITQSTSKDVTLAINSSTVIASGIKAGDKVNVIASADANQNYTALIIGKSFGALDRKLIVDVVGTVKSTGSTWVIHDTRNNTDVSLLVTSQTIVSANIAVGDTVSATGLNTTTPPTAVVILKLPTR